MLFAAYIFSNASTNSNFHENYFTKQTRWSATVFILSFVASVIIGKGTDFEPYRPQLLNNAANDAIRMKCTSWM
jgi:hypothetical protein